MTPSKIFLYFCLSFIGGIFLDSFFTFPLLVFAGGLILGILLISIFWKYKNFVVIGFCILFLMTGIWRHQSMELKIENNELRKLNDLGQNITLIGIVVDEPDIREKSIKLTINSKQLTTNNEQFFIEGKVLIITNRYPEYEYGDKLKITGTLKTPAEDITGFSYKNYLKKDGIYSIMEWPEIELIDKNQGNILYKYLFSFKNKFQETARNFISPPQQGILEALIFGEESNISKEWKDKLNFTGTRHITAVSGMNITILAFLILSFLLFLGFWRQQAFYLSIFLLFLYILMIGAPASAVRAGIMGGLLLLAQYLGRMTQATRAVIFAATFMLFLNPLLLKLDIGFQLSFLAILGIIFFQPIFTGWLKKIPNPGFFPLRITLSTTLAAQVYTLPILIYNFGYIPLVSPVTNTLIVPFLAPLTILIFIFGIAGMIFYWLGFIFSLPLWLGLTYVTTIVDLFSKIPFSSMRLEDIHWTFLIIVYLILAIITWRLQENQKLKILNY